MPKWTQAAFLGSVALALAAQGLLCYHPDLTWVGVAGYVVAIGLFVASVLRARASSIQRRVPIRHPAWRLLTAVCAVGLVAWATTTAHGEQAYARAAVLWLAGVALAVISFCAPRTGGRKPRRGRWREVSLVGLLFAAALALRLVRLADYPTPMLGDEGSMALDVMQILRGELLNPFGTGWFSHPTMFFYLEAAALQVFGRNLFGLRFTAALLGALGVPAVYYLARNSFGRQTATISAAFLTGWGLPLHLSRLALNNSADPLFGALVLGLLQQGLVRGRRWCFAASGLALGMSLYFYHGTRLLFPLVLLTLALSGTRRLRQRWRGLVTLAFVALLVAGPLLIHFVQSPDTFMSRHTTLDVFRSGELEAEQRQTGESATAILLRHLGQAGLAFIAVHDRGFFYTPNTPMLLVLSGALFVLGVELALWHWRQVRYQVLLAWFGLTVIFGGWLLKSPPHYQRYLIAAPAVCLLVGRAAVILLRRAARIWAWNPGIVRRSALVVAAVLLAINAAIYFGVYLPSGAFSDRNTEIADRTARLMTASGPEYTTYFFGTPRMPLSGFNSVPFLAPDADWTDVPMTQDEADWSYVQAGHGALFVILQEREDSLLLLRERFPDGVEQQVLGRDGQRLFTTYRVALVRAQQLDEGEVQ